MTTSPPSLSVSLPLPLSASLSLSLSLSACLSASLSASLFFIVFLTMFYQLVVVIFIVKVLAVENFNFNFSNTIVLSRFCHDCVRSYNTLGRSKLAQFVPNSFHTFRNLPILKFFPVDFVEALYSSF